MIHHVQGHLPDGKFEEFAVDVAVGDDLVPVRRSGEFCPGFAEWGPELG
jgi:hypothetical protein